MNDIKVKSHKMEEHFPYVFLFYISNTIIQEDPNQFTILFVVYDIPDEAIVVYPILCGLHLIYLYNRFLITMY